MAGIRFQQPDRDFAMIPHQLMRDQSLSMEARGFMALMLGMKDGWVYDREHLMRIAGFGETKGERVIAELKQRGLLAIEREAGADFSRGGWRWKLLDPYRQNDPMAMPAFHPYGQNDPDIRRTTSDLKKTKLKDSAPSEPSLFKEDPSEKEESSIPHSESPTTARESKPDLFARFWAAYPKCKRKTDKPICAAVFANIVAGKAKGIPKTDPEAIIAGAEGYAASNPDPEYIKAPVGWLRGARWEQHQPAPAPDTSKPDEIALLEARQAAANLRDNPPWIDRKSGKVEAQRERRWMGQVARVLIWEQKGVDPAAKDSDWWLRVDFTARLERLAGYGLRSAPRTGDSVPPHTNGHRTAEARV